MYFVLPRKFSLIPRIAYSELTSSYRNNLTHQEVMELPAQNSTKNQSWKSKAPLIPQTAGRKISLLKKKVITYPTAQEQATPVRRSQNHQLPEKELKENDKGKNAMVRSGYLLRTLNSCNLTWKKLAGLHYSLFYSAVSHSELPMPPTLSPDLQSVVKFTSLYPEK